MLYVIRNTPTSPNFDARPSDVQITHIVIHAMTLPAETSLDILCNSGPNHALVSTPVSAHYLVCERPQEDGRIPLHQLVAPEQRAWHAGKSFWRGAHDLNATSIGIELVNDHAAPYPHAQVQAALALITDIQNRYAIAPWNIVAHADIAPDRKTDPGAHFPWGLLNAFVGDTMYPLEPADPLQALRRIGYGVDDYSAEKCIQAFQSRFRPARVDGILDDETSTLIRKVAQSVPPWNL